MALIASSGRNISIVWCCVARFESILCIKRVLLADGQFNWHVATPLCWMRWNGWVCMSAMTTTCMSVLNDSTMTRNKKHCNWPVIDPVKTWYLLWTHTPWHQSTVMSNGCVATHRAIFWAVTAACRILHRTSSPVGPRWHTRYVMLQFITMCWKVMISLEGSPRTGHCVELMYNTLGCFIPDGFQAEGMLS